jgi:hypothetical protein
MRNFYWNTNLHVRVYISIPCFMEQNSSNCKQILMWFCAISRFRLINVFILSSEWIWKCRKLFEVNVNSATILQYPYTVPFFSKFYKMYFNLAATFSVWTCLNNFKCALNAELLTTDRSGQHSHCLLLRHWSCPHFPITTLTAVAHANASSYRGEHKKLFRNYVRFHVFTAVAMKNAVFYDIKIQFAPHRKHVMSPLKSQAG